MNEADILNGFTTSRMQIAGLVFFVLAILHTFATKQVAILSHRFPENSFGHNLLHFLGEVEIVFGFWAFLFLVYASIFNGIKASISYLDQVSFNEPAFVFCIMCVAATKPIMQAAKSAISAVSKIITKLIIIDEAIVRYFVILFFGPMLGSLITEPAAMTVSALLILEYLQSNQVSQRFKYSTIGLLFVNISIGGVLTNYAAPPVIMVANKWNWTTSFMIQNFGWRAILTILLSTLITTIIFRKEIIESIKILNAPEVNTKPSPLWMIAVHIGFMLLMILYHKHIPFFLSLFFLFIGWHQVTKHHQEELRLRESLLVGFFLAGLVTLGNMQGWWLEKTITLFNEQLLFFGAAALTSVTDNAALTYLGSLVPSLTEKAKYMLVAGSVAGGGLTVIANAPNPAGYGILRDSFGEDGISPLYLFLAALPYTLLALFAFGFPL